MIKHLIVLLSLTVVACGQPPTNTPRSLATTSAIIGGTHDTSASPVVLIRARLGIDTGYCSGVIVSPHVVLTAGHCTSVAGATYSIFIGDDLATQGDMADLNFAVRSRRAHPRYDQTTYAYDIGVIVTEAALPRQPAGLNRTPLDSSFVGHAAKLVGFGQTIAGDEASIGKRNVAQSTFAAVDPPGYVTFRGTPNICLVDSGGPALMEQDGQDVVAAIHHAVSASTCDGEGYSVRVDVVLDFIDAEIAAADPTPDAGTGEDAGSDAGPDGEPDAGTDAGVVATDAGTSDGGDLPGTTEPPGCAVAPMPGLVMLGLLVIARARHGRRR